MQQYRLNVCSSLLPGTLVFGFSGRRAGSGRTPPSGLVSLNLLVVLGARTFGAPNAVAAGDLPAQVRHGEYLIIIMLRRLLSVSSVYVCVLVCWCVCQRHCRCEFARFPVVHGKGLFIHEM